MKMRCVGIVVALGALLVAGGCGDTKSDEGAGTQKTAPAKTPAEPLLKKKEVADWCKEHVVPESICTRCNAALIPGFKSKGDWCKEHDLPESQCFVCHPELEAKFKAMAPKEESGK